MEVVHKIGRRKTAVARVYVSEGSGNITVNKRNLNDYFTTGTLQYKVKQPFTLTETEGNYDVKVNVYVYVYGCTALYVYVYAVYGVYIHVYTLQVYV